MEKLVSMNITCRKCKKEHRYSSNEVEFDHLICKSCGEKIYVVRFADQVNTDYKKLPNGQIVRTKEKPLSKKARKRLK
jgi:hypothetical protein